MGGSGDLDDTEGSRLDGEEGLEQKSRSFVGGGDPTAEPQGPEQELALGPSHLVPKMALSVPPCCYNKTADWAVHSEQKFTGSQR